MSTLFVTVLGWCESATVRLAYYADRLDTYVQTKAGAARYRNGAGCAPSKRELARIRALNLQAFKDEYFDYLAKDRPPIADSATVELFQSTRGEVEHR